MKELLIVFYFSDIKDNRMENKTYSQTSPETCWDLLQNHSLAFYTLRDP